MVFLELSRKLNFSGFARFKFEDEDWQNLNQWWLTMKPQQKYVVLRENRNFNPGYADTMSHRTVLFSQMDLILWCIPLWGGGELCMCCWWWDFGSSHWYKYLYFSQSGEFWSNTPLNKVKEISMKISLIELNLVEKLSRGNWKQNIFLLGPWCGTPPSSWNS